MSQFEVTMPALGKGVNVVSLVKWHKSIGEEISLDETLFEISSDKIVAEVPSPVSGRVTEVFFSEGSSIPVGEVIAKIDLCS